MSKAFRNAHSYFSDRHSRSMKTLSIQRPRPSVEMRLPASFSVLVRHTARHLERWRRRRQVVENSVEHYGPDRKLAGIGPGTAAHHVVPSSMARPTRSTRLRRKEAQWRAWVEAAGLEDKLVAGIAE